MKLRKSTESDVKDIMNLIHQAQAYFAEQGIPQWRNNYPNKKVIENDIKNNYSHVVTDNNKIVATAAISFDGEITYDKIYNGNWLSNAKYAVVHRIAVDNNFKGQNISSIILKHVEKSCLENGVHSIKIDTHEKNISMQKMLKKNGFQYCGTIFILDGSERLAFEKLL